MFSVVFISFVLQVTLRSESVCVEMFRCLVRSTRHKKLFMVLIAAAVLSILSMGWHAISESGGRQQDSSRISLGLRSVHARCLQLAARQLSKCSYFVVVCYAAMMYSYPCLPKHILCRFATW